MEKYRVIAILILVAVVAAALALKRAERVTVVRLPLPAAAASGDIELIKNPRTVPDKIVNGAKMQVIRGVRYDASYASIPYPNGDVPAGQGACTDVIIRALRNAGFDLQKLIHEDMKRNFSLYPKKWGLRAPDRNIDHRRVPNQIVFMKRFGKELSIETNGDTAESWKPGDLVYWDLTGNNLTHCGVISNERGDSGLPLVIHNIGPVASQEDCLTRWKIIGHFRYPKS